MSGIMINIVARRVVLSPKATVIETLQQIQSEQLEINQHENISFSMLQSKGIPVLSLFDTILNFRNQVFNTAVDDSAEDRLFHKPRKGAFGRYVNFSAFCLPFSDRLCYTRSEYPLASGSCCL